MTTQEDHEQVDDFLAHYGVKGMRWGHRKAQADAGPKPTSRDIKDARARVAVARRQEMTNAGSRRDKASIALLGELSPKLSQEYRANPDRVVAGRLTKGEKAVVAIFAPGSAGTILPLIAINKGIQNHVKKDQRKAAAGG